MDQARTKAEAKRLACRVAGHFLQWGLVDRRDIGAEPPDQAQRDRYQAAVRELIAELLRRGGPDDPGSRAPSLDEVRRRETSET